jgi:tetratricopeptide (TPR) repeat protein
MFSGQFSKSLTLCLLGAILLLGCATLELTKAEIMMSRKKYAESIPILKQYLAKNPDSFQARSRLGFAYLKTGQLDAAIVEFKKSLEIKPGEPYATLYLGMAYLNKEDFDGAIDVWRSYRNTEKPLVEREVKRLTRLIRIAEAHRAARKALAMEKQLDTVKQPPNTVAVFYYQDRSAEKGMQAFQKGLAAMVITDLSKIKSLQVVERIRIQALLQEMKLGQTGIVDQKTAPRMGMLVGAENLVLGNLDQGIAVTTALASSSRGNIKGTAAVTVPEQRFFEIPKKIVLDIAGIMKIKLNSQEMAALGVPHTKNFEAFIFYGEALVALDAGRWETAKDLFTSALGKDPKFYLASEGYESCPRANAPSISKLATMTTPELVSLAQESLDLAEAEQAALSAEQEDTTSGNGGGH